MRALWSGTLSFGLINIPVRLYSASVDRQFNFKLLDKKDMCPIGYVRVCKNDHREVPYDDIVKGYEYEKGDYVVLQDDDFKKANAQKTESIEVVSFVDEDEVESKYIDKPYYVEPDKKAMKAYVLLREALVKTKKVGVARYVLRTKERIGMVKVEGDAIMLIQLRYQNELRPVEDLHIPDTSSYSAKEVQMAVMLINQLSEPFEIEKYEDTYAEEMKKMIAKKAKGKKITVKKTVAPQPTSTDEIFEALKRSLAKQGKHKTKSK